MKLTSKTQRMPISVTTRTEMLRDIRCVTKTHTYSCVADLGLIAFAWDDPLRMIDLLASGTSLCKSHVTKHRYCSPSQL